VSEPPARYIVAVGSGKGGVGKSTVSLNIARALARRGLALGFLDADVYGPDIPLMVNLTRREDAREWDFWRRGDVRHEPIESHGIRIMSAGFSALATVEGVAAQSEAFDVVAGQVLDALQRRAAA
jgi:ATP-binding protein involved in chromosome partitioning